jgi:hypothetical protein
VMNDYLNLSPNAGARLRAGSDSLVVAQCFPP